MLRSPFKPVRGFRFVEERRRLIRVQLSERVFRKMIFLLCSPFKKHFCAGVIPRQKVSLPVQLTGLVLRICIPALRRAEQRPERRLHVFIRIFFFTGGVQQPLCTVHRMLCAAVLWILYRVKLLFRLRRGTAFFCNAQHDIFQMPELLLCVQRRGLFRQAVPVCGQHCFAKLPPRAVCSLHLRLLFQFADNTIHNGFYRPGEIPILESPLSVPHFFRQPFQQGFQNRHLCRRIPHPGHRLFQTCAEQVPQFVPAL